MNYKYVKAYKSDENLIKSYHNFTQSIFGFDLINWRNEDCWDNKYIPHSLIYNGRIIANISASIMQLQIMGKDVSAIQLGTVGVVPEYRGKGLSRILIEKVLEEYNQFPLVFLFANHNVLDFYPKLGFRSVNESVAQIDVSDYCIQIRKATKITKDSEYVRRLLDSKLQHSSLIDARGNNSIYRFHLMYNYSENIYYIEDKNIVFVMKHQGDSVIILDVLSKAPINFEDIIGYVPINNSKKVYFHFTPDWLLHDYKIASNEDDVMYVIGEFPSSITNFKFPVTSHT